MGFSLEISICITRARVQGVPSSPPPPNDAQGLAGASQGTLPPLLAAPRGCPPFPCPPPTRSAMITPIYPPTPHPAATIHPPAHLQSPCKTHVVAVQGAAGGLLASFCRALEQLSPNMEGFFCLRFSARRPRPKSAAFQMLRSAALFSAPPLRLLLHRLPVRLALHPLGEGECHPPDLPASLDPPPASSAAGASRGTSKASYWDFGGRGKPGRRRVPSAGTPCH